MADADYEGVDGGQRGENRSSYNALLIILVIMAITALVLLYFMIGSSNALFANESGNIAGFATGKLLASGANGQDRDDISSDSVGTIKFTAETKASGNYKIQPNLKNGRAFYKGDNGCTIEYQLEDSAWAAVCDGIALYKSYFGTESAPTNGWEGVPPVTDFPKVILVSGILVPENAGESFIVGGFVEDGMRNNRMKYVNNKGCQIYFRKNLNSTAHASEGDSFGEWNVMCWGDHCERWDILYKVQEKKARNLPPLSGWEAVNGVKPVPTFAVYEATVDTTPEHEDTTLDSTIGPGELQAVPPSKNQKAASAEAEKKYDAFLDGFHEKLIVT